MDGSRSERDEGGLDKPVQGFIVGAIETIAFFVGLAILSRVAGISFDSTAVTILFVCSGLAALGLTLLVVRARNRG